MENLEALREVIDLSVQTGKISWAWLNKIKKLAKHFQITPDEMMGVVSSYDRVDQAEEWLNKNRPKIVK